MELNKIYNIPCQQGIGRIDSESVDLVVTSPPYADLREGSSIDLKDYTKWFRPINEGLYRIIKNTGFYALNIGNIYRNKTFLRYHFDIMDQCEDIGFNLVDIVIWFKPNGIKPKTPIGLLSSYEPIFVFSKSKDFKTEDVREEYAESTKKRVLNETSQGFVALYNGDRFQTLNKQGKTPNNVIPIGVGHNRGVTLHTSTFPLRLPKFFINKLTSPNALVVDPFMGSGTTAEACRQLNRNFIGFETNPEYIKIAEQRIKTELGQARLPLPPQGVGFESSPIVFSQEPRRERQPFSAEEKGGLGDQ